MKVGQIAVRVDPLFFLLVIFLSVYNSNFDPVGSLIWGVVIFLSVFVHELGHAFTALFFGQTASIEFVGFGGVTRRHGPSISLLQEFILVLNGPLAGFCLALLAGGMLTFFGNDLPTILKYFLLITAYANIFWTVVNLLPIQPLDGGHLLRIALTSVFGLKGTKIALFLSFLFSLFITLVFFYWGFLLVGSLILLFAFEGFRAWKNSLKVTEKDEDDNNRLLLKSAEKDFRKGNIDFALQKFYTLREHTAKGVLYTTATERIAEILSAKGRDQEAFDLLAPLSSGLDDHMKKVFQGTAVRLKKWNEAIQIGNKLYQDRPSIETAITNAISHSMLGQVIPAVGWIKCAIRDGLQDSKSLLALPEFNPIRSDPLFQSLQNQE